MAPVRKEDGFRARPIKDWQSWIDEAIETAQAEGQFDNLPGQGKPIRIETNPFEPEMDAAYSTLRQAGYAPTWMELDREITTSRAELDAWLERSAAYLERLVREDQRSPVRSDPAPVRPPSLWQRMKRFLNIAAPPDERPISRPVEPPDPGMIRATMRIQYLEKAAAIDRTIGRFHASLPRNLWHLERMGLPPEIAGRRFDERIPEQFDARHP